MMPLSALIVLPEVIVVVPLATPILLLIVIALVLVFEPADVSRVKLVAFKIPAVLMVIESGVLKMMLVAVRANVGRILRPESISIELSGVVLLPCATVRVTALPVDAERTILGVVSIVLTVTPAPPSSVSEFVALMAGLVLLIVNMPVVFKVTFAAVRAPV
jgi:hypothetical protein